MLDKRYDRFDAWLKEQPIEELAANEKAQREKNDKDFERLKDALAEGKCSYCGNDLTHFSTKKPCLHWLLKPKGFKKKHFPLLYEGHCFRSINTYLRWVANSDGFGQNINDLVAERQSGKFIEETIKYKNLEWSFSCSETDRVGHKEAHKGSMPHYHFQMKVDGNVVINYNAFHIPFTEYDEFSFAVEAGRFQRLKSVKGHDAGMQAIFDAMEGNPEFAEVLEYTEDEDGAAFSTDIFITAEPGTHISGDALADLFEERERTGKSMAQLAKKLPNTTVETFISPGKGIPEMAVRSGGRRKKAPE